MMGSWDGGMGQCQFMPVSYLRIAVDGNGDGKKDIWHSIQDVLHSIGHYLHLNRWELHAPCFSRVSVPAGFRASLKWQPVSWWLSKGVRFIESSPEIHSTRHAKLIFRETGKKGVVESFLVYQNFENILEWNRSYNYALGACSIAAAIAKN